MIYVCPRCHKKNRLPDHLQPGGEYRCGQCRELFSGAPARPRSWEGFRRIQVKMPPLALTLSTVVYLLLVLTLLISADAGPEQWWLGSLNLYLPQWLWAVPGVLLLPPTFFWARRWVWVPLGALGCVAGPIMGLCVGGWLPAPAAAPGQTHLRVMTYNVKWDSRNEGAILHDIRLYHPDLLQLQDSDGVLRGQMGRELEGWNVRVSNQYIVATHLPLSDMEWRDISIPGSLRHCIRSTVQLGARSVTVYNVHFLSPRDGLVSVGHQQVDGLVWNARARLQEADMLEGYLHQEHGPILLTGDLNAPVQSLVCRRLQATGLRDAFSEAGAGYGYTYGRYTQLKRPYVRIDHIMASPQWQVQRCWVGNAQGSDHCPVIADLVLLP